MGVVDKQSKSYIKRSGDAKKALDQVAKNLEKAIAEIGLITEDTLDEVALSILNKSLTYAPLDTGELRESAYTDFEKTNSNYTVEIGYGKDGKAPYAVYTHEIGPYNNPTTPGTNYKFLQRAATEVESDIPAIVADAIRNQLK